MRMPRGLHCTGHLRAVRTLEWPGHRVKMLARRVLVALKSRLSPGAREGGQGGGVERQAQLGPRNERASPGWLAETDLRRQGLSCCGVVSPLPAGHRHQSC